MLALETRTPNQAEPCSSLKMFISKQLSPPTKPSTMVSHKCLGVTSKLIITDKAFSIELHVLHMMSVMFSLSWPTAPSNQGTSLQPVLVPTKMKKVTS